MAFVKLVKSKAYFKRFQVKYRRRREGKTDYYARKRLVTQDKNKYNSPKYRMVVRFTATDIVCQIVYSKIEGDYVLASAYAHELPRYGVKLGLTNWSAAYCTGLLLARRVLTQLKMADTYEGVTEPDGTYSIVEPVDGERRPFKAFLDVGTRRTTTGSRLFGAVKGASDGGLYVPHNPKRFPGYEPDSKELDQDTLRSYIFGEHVSEYMKMLEDEDPERYQQQFKRYIDEGVAADDLEDMYASCHQAIRDDPTPKSTDKSKLEEYKKASKAKMQTKRTRKQRVNRVKQIKDAFAKLNA